MNNLSLAKENPRREIEMLDTGHQKKKRKKKKTKKISKHISKSPMAIYKNHHSSLGFPLYMAYNIWR